MPGTISGHVGGLPKLWSPRTGISVTGVFPVRRAVQPEYAMECSAAQLRVLARVARVDPGRVNAIAATHQLRATPARARRRSLPQEQYSACGIPVGRRRVPGAATNFRATLPGGHGGHLLPSAEAGAGNVREASPGADQKFTVVIKPHQKAVCLGLAGMPPGAGAILTPRNVARSSARSIT